MVSERKSPPTSTPTRFSFDRERILLGGLPGSGKTYAWLTIAQMLPQHTFHVVDPDLGASRVWLTEFPDVENVHYYFTPTWFNKLDEDKASGRPNIFRGGVREAYQRIEKRVAPDDWVVVEMMGNVWNMASTSFVEEIFNKDVGEYFLERRKDMEATKSKKLEALGGWDAWSVIKKMHNDDFIVPVCYHLPVHVVLTTSISITTNQLASREDAELRSFYGDNLIRLEGEKINPYRVQSILLLKHPSKSQWNMSTFIKDRARKWLDNEPLYNFGMQYLYDVAGWVQ